LLFLTIEVFSGNLVEAAFNALNAKLVFKPVNSKSMLYFLTKHAQYAVEPLPLPILIPLGFLVKGRCGKAKNQANLLVLSDFFTALFKNNLNLNICEADKWTGLRIIRPAPPKFNFFFR
jgi:hypothetical protein